MTRLSRAGVRAAVAAFATLVALPVSAAVDVGLDYATEIGLPYMDIRTIVADVIRAGLGFVGFVLMIQILHGGFKYMIAGGSEDARAAAIAGLKHGVIGFIIIMSASSITHFVVDAVANATGGGIL